MPVNAKSRRTRHARHAPQAVFIPTGAAIDQAVELANKSHPKDGSRCANCAAMLEAMRASKHARTLIAANCRLLDRMIAFIRANDMDVKDVRDQIARYVLVIMRESMQIGAISGRIEEKEPSDA